MCTLSYRSVRSTQKIKQVSSLGGEKELQRREQLSCLCQAQSTLTESTLGPSRYPGTETRYRDQLPGYPGTRVPGCVCHTYASRARVGGSPHEDCFADVDEGEECARAPLGLSARVVLGPLPCARAPLGLSARVASSGVASVVLLGSPALTSPSSCCQAYRVPINALLSPHRFASEGSFATLGPPGELYNLV